MAGGFTFINSHASAEAEGDPLIGMNPAVVIIFCSVGSSLAILLGESIFLVKNI